MTTGRAFIKVQHQANEGDATSTLLDMVRYPNADATAGGLEWVYYGTVTAATTASTNVTLDDFTSVDGATSAGDRLMYLIVKAASTNTDDAVIAPLSGLALLAGSSGGGVTLQAGEEFIFATATGGGGVTLGSGDGITLDNSGGAGTVSIDVWAGTRSSS